jgi:aminoglycoside phosphotransferase (APT) family kinase protein
VTVGDQVRDSSAAEPNSQDTAAGSVTLLEPAALTAFLATQPELSTALPLESVERIGQGQSNVTFQVRLSKRTIILRRPPAGPLPPRAHDVLREYRIMRALADSSVPVPRMLASCEDPAVIGVPFFLMEALPGDAIRFELPPWLASAPSVTLASIGLQVVDALAMLHRTDPTAVGLAELGPPVGYVGRQLRRWRGQLEYARVRPAPDLEAVADWLEANQPSDVAQPSIVHGDYKLDNVLFSQEASPRLLAVVDWELSTLGDPLADLGWLLAFWREPGDPPPEVRVLPRVTELPGFSTRAELAARYAERTGWQLPDLRFYVVFALWRMAILLEGHWARHMRGTAEDFDFDYLESAGPRFAAQIRRTAEAGS